MRGQIQRSAPLTFIYSFWVNDKILKITLLSSSEGFRTLLQEVESRLTCGILGDLGLPTCFDAHPKGFKYKEVISFDLKKYKTWVIDTSVFSSVLRLCLTLAD